MPLDDVESATTEELYREFQVLTIDHVEALAKEPKQVRDRVWIYAAASSLEGFTKEYPTLAKQQQSIRYFQQESRSKLAMMQIIGQSSMLN